jgi:hypothetical protein
MLLPNNRKVRFVSQQRKHDQICVCAVETVASIGIVSIFEPQLSDVVKHLMLTLTRYHTVSQHHHLQVLVKRVGTHFVFDKEVQLVAEFHHELCPGGDRIRVKQVGNVFALGI